jgi:hypothetical protein
MTNIVNYIRRPAVFEPEVVAIMAEAYELALASFDTGPIKTIREVVAGRIIALAQKGERDPRALCEHALAGLGRHSRCEPADKTAGPPSP